MATFGGGAMGGGGMSFGGGRMSFGGGGMSGGGMPGGGGMSFSSGGMPFGGGGNGNGFNGTWDFGTNNPIPSQGNKFMGGNMGQKPEAVPETVSSVTLVAIGCACLLWSRFKRVSHS